MWCMSRQFLIFLIAISCCAEAAHAKRPQKQAMVETDSRFAIEVQSVLAKAGCNAGTCHGNFNGKGGFRLSLRGQDPSDDHEWITRDHAGRRINLMDPAESLLLAKPTGRVSHQGGRRFDEDSLEYQILFNWIACGAPAEADEDARLESIDVLPLDVVVRDPADSVNISVLARYSDGSSRDVTSLAVYEPSSLDVEVTADGTVIRKKYGESTVVVRYLQKQVPVRVAFVPRVKGQRRIQYPESANFVDEHVFTKLKELGIKPSSLASDEVFVRRVFLDAIGVLPTADEARAFISNDSPTKRVDLIDTLLSRDEFAEFWALKWSDVLRNEEKVLDVKGVEVYHDWILQSMKENKPIDQFVRELLLGRGSTFENPPANFWRTVRTPIARSETTARLFLGVRLGCAKCHNHPFDRWTQDDYYDWTSFFARIDYEWEEKRRDKFDKNEFVGDQVVKITDEGEVKNARTGVNAQPRFLGLHQFADVKVAGTDQRIEELAAWITSADNKFFVKSQVNRIWFHLMGRGLVEPVDDFRLTNPASHPALLNALADRFVSSKFDLRALARDILISNAYQIGSDINETNQNDELNYSRVVMKRYQAEVLLDAQCQTIGRPAKFNGYPEGMRAVQLPGVRKVRRRDESPADGDLFLEAFGKPERLLACECERSDETTLNQVFILCADDGMVDRLADPNNLLKQLADSDMSNRAIVDEVFLSALSRFPMDSERGVAVAMLNHAQGKEVDSEYRSVTGQYLDDEVDRWVVLQDIVWALINSKEYVFRH